AAEEICASLGFWFGAVVCFLFTLLSVITFLLDRTRFQYPERPFVYIIMCYCMMSAVYITGYGLGDSVSCATNPNNPNATRVLVRGTNQNTPCAILFMVEYFFMMASSLWHLFSLASPTRDILLGFVIIPNSIFLLLGVVFLLIGFASLIKIRRFVKKSKRRSN
uniref:G_PROTEIN_RECEP_F2_4 domain-containing protein n=1 Tax=Macrostomum lignano TaxID=282301 RepID=A0A1I8JQL9_9PLAT